MPKKKTAKQKKADAAFIDKVKSLGFVTNKSELHKLAEKHGIPTEFTCEHGSKFKLKAATEVAVRVTVEQPKHDDSGEEGFAA